MNQLISNVLMQPKPDATECPKEIKEYWASYATDSERFGEGPYNSIEEAKADIIDQYKQDIAKGTWDVGDWTTFYIGVRKDFKDIAKNHVGFYADSVIEHIGEDIDCDYHLDDPSITTTEKNRSLMIKMLEKFFDECEFDGGFIVEDIQEFELEKEANK